MTLFLIGGNMHKIKWPLFFGGIYMFVALVLLSAYKESQTWVIVITSYLITFCVTLPFYDAITKKKEEEK